MSEAEKKVLNMYGESMPTEAPPPEPTWVNHIVLTLLVLALAMIVWLTLALVNAENQRNAYATKACPDPVFPGAADPKCMAGVKTREHWWDHVGYALTHLHP